MNDLVNTALQAFGLKELAVTKLDLKLLTDEIGRTLPIGATSGQYVGTASINWLGKGNGEDPSSAGYSNHGTAFSVVSYILDTAAPIPWGVYKLDGADNRAELQPKHPLSALLYRPNPKQTWAQLKRQAQGSYEVNGEFFLRAVRPAVRSGGRGGKTAEIWCLVGKVELLPLTGLGEFDMPTGYRHTDAITGRVTDYPAEEILHEFTWNPRNPHRGLSPVAAGSDAITAAKSGLESRVREYQNQGPAGLLYSKATALGDADTWTAEQANRVQQWFSGFFQGGKRGGQIPIVNKDMGYLSMGLSPVDLDVLAAIPYDKDAICDLWHFPGQLLNGSKGTTFSNMGEAGAALYNRCVIPLETVFKDSLNRWLGPEYNDEVYIDFSTEHIPELQEDLKDQIAALKDCHWMSNWDKQARMGLKVDKRIPEYLFPSTLVTLEELGTPPVGADAATGAGEAIN
jgi:phage portal protein BeeE